MQSYGEQYTLAMGESYPSHVNHLLVDGSGIVWIFFTSHWEINTASLPGYRNVLLSSAGPLAISSRNHYPTLQVNEIKFLIST